MKRWGIMIVALAVAQVSLPADAQRSAFRAVDVEKRRFDHGKHEAVVRAAGKTLGCNGACHPARADGTLTAQPRDGSAGRKGKQHGRCDQCHKIYRSGCEANRSKGKACIVCHQNWSSRCFEGPRPDWANLDPTYVATYSHKQHIQPGASSGRQCEMCHGQFGDGQPRVGPFGGGHQMCSGCHERGVEPLMKDCGSCHVASSSAAGKHPVAKPRVKTPYAVAGAFDHQRHARADRVGTRGRECLTCHGNIEKARDNYTIPMPTMQGCYKDCHNGKGAFDATGATCTRCHTGPRGGRP